MRTRIAGFAFVELLVSLLLMSVVLAGVVGVFSNQSHTQVQQDLAVSMEQNLRLGMGMVTDAMRTAGYGVPKSDLSTWISWVPEFTQNPQISGSSPTSVSVASCFQTVAHLAAGVAAGSTILPLQSDIPGQTIADLFDASAKSLALLDDADNVRVTHANETSITIDRDPMTAGTQGVLRAYPAGTPVCRVDVLTFSIRGRDGASPWLALDTHQGSEAKSVGDGINNLAVTTVVARQQYTITLNARSERVDPLTGTYLTRSLSSNVTLKN